MVAAFAVANAIHICLHEKLQSSRYLTALSVLSAARGWSSLALLNFKLRLAGIILIQGQLNASIGIRQLILWKLHHPSALVEWLRRWVLTNWATKLTLGGLNRTNLLADLANLSPLPPLPHKGSGFLSVMSNEPIIPSDQHANSPRLSYADALASPLNFTLHLSLLGWALTPDDSLYAMLVTQEQALEFAGRYIEAAK